MYRTALQMVRKQTDVFPQPRDMNLEVNGFSLYSEGRILCLSTSVTLVYGLVLAADTGRDQSPACRFADGEQRVSRRRRDRWRGWANAHPPGYRRPQGEMRAFLLQDNIRYTPLSNMSRCACVCVC